MSDSMEATKQIRLFICLKILFFNVFVLGFVLSFIGLTNINWIVGHNYLFGIFNYCRGVADASSRHYVFLNEGNKFVHRAIDNLNCYSWTGSNRPSNLIVLIICPLYLLEIEIFSQRIPYDVFIFAAVRCSASFGWYCVGSCCGAHLQQT